ncbi:MAG TPA: universal stress protein [Pyrinomonadaceae bacterium]|jgi:nucleotide-binding universal stress UspA family protein
MKILLATDGTKHSDCAIQMIEKFNLSDGDELKIVSVVDMALPLSIDVYSGYLPTTADLEKTAQENAEKILETASENIQKTFTGKNVFLSTETLLGSPERRIVESAEEMKADLIVLGSHGYNRWERLLLGSVSDSVIHHAPCSVLIVRGQPKTGEE